MEEDYLFTIGVDGWTRLDERKRIIEFLSQGSCHTPRQYRKLSTNDLQIMYNEYTERD
jgi:hypothetical protein